MIVDCVSDLHGHYPELKAGDLLIVAGDLTANDQYRQYENFCDWCLNLLAYCKYKKIVWISGNHNNWLQKNHELCMHTRDYQYLCDSGIEFEGLKIWGSPWTKTFEGMNPQCKAFTVDTEEELAEKWALIPNDVDILVTHSPMFHYLDKTIDGKYAGSGTLRLRTREIMKENGEPIKLHVCGHIHEGYGQEGDGVITNRVNASHVNEHYQPVNRPVRIIL